MVAEKREGLLNMEQSYEQKVVKENKAGIDRVIEEICACSTRKNQGGYGLIVNFTSNFKQFLPKQMNTKNKTKMCCLFHFGHPNEKCVKPVM